MELSHYMPGAMSAVGFELISRTRHVTADRRLRQLGHATNTFVRIFWRALYLFYGTGQIVIGTCYLHGVTV